jgi:triacylglycerol lipase
MATNTPVMDANTMYALCAYVDKTGTTLPAGWEVVWQPLGWLPQNYAMVFQLSSTSTYAVAIQGTQNAWDALHDFHIVPQPAFAPINDAAIAQGTQDSLKAVLDLRNTKLETLSTFLSKLTAGSCLTVTGHSLGGNVASAMVPYLAANLSVFGGSGNPISSLPANLAGVTFAAPSAGNQAFADFLNACSSNYVAHFNQYDVISNVWATSGQLNMNTIDSLFPSPGLSPAPGAVQQFITSKEQQLKTSQISYAQTNGSIFKFPSKAPPSDSKDPWLWELGYQHNNAYASTFGAGDGSGSKS